MNPLKIIQVLKEPSEVRIIKDIPENCRTIEFTIRKDGKPLHVFWVKTNE